MPDCRLKEENDNMGKRLSAKQKRSYDRKLAEKLLRGRRIPYLWIAGERITAPWTKSQRNEAALTISSRWAKRIKHNDENILRKSRFWDENLRQTQAKRLEEAEHHPKPMDAEVFRSHERNFLRRTGSDLFSSKWW